MNAKPYTSVEDFFLSLSLSRALGSKLTHAEGTIKSLIGSGPDLISPVSLGKVMRAQKGHTYKVA